MIIDPEKVASVIAEIAEEEITPRFGALTDGEIDTKSGPQDFVTAADHAAEARLERALGDIYPGAGFIGEESAAADASRLEWLEQEDGAFWIVDPLDGTRNFVNGREEFGTIIALVENGEIRQGWIYAIPQRVFAIGSAGDGVTWGGKTLTAVSAKPGTPVGYRAVGTMKKPWSETLVKNMRARLETEPARCSAYVYINLARGIRDFAFYSRCSPWDHAAGVMMLRELGGRAEYLDDNSPYRAVATFGRPLLVANNEESWAASRATLFN